MTARSTSNHQGALPANIILPAVLSFLAAFSFSFSGTVSANDSLLRQITAETQGFSFIFFACAAMLAWISCRCWESYRSGTCINTKTIAGLFSACMLIGLSYSANNSWDFIFGGTHQFVIALSVFAGYLYFFDLLVVFAYRFIREDRFGLFRTSGAERRAALSVKHFLTAFAVIYAGWLLWLIPFFPGSVPHDGANQISQYFGWISGGVLNNHHPWVLTVIMGSIVRAGRLVGDNFAIGLAVFVFSVIECLIYAYVCSIIKQKFRSAKLYTAFVLFYSLVPAFGAFAHALLKDGLYAAVMSLYVVIYLNVFSALICKNPNLLTGDIIKLICVSLAVSILRNEGIYIVLCSSVVLLIVAGRRKCIPVLLIIAVICLNITAWNLVSKKKIGIATPFTKEMLSIPLQQTARFVRDYPNDVSAAEEKAIGSFMDYKRLAKVYDPLNSDPVKGFNVPIVKHRFLDYLKAWKSMFWKHPDAYIQATLNNTFGYFYPFCTFPQSNQIKLNNPFSYPAFCSFRQVGGLFYIKHELLPKDFNNEYVFSDSVRNTLASYYLLWTHVPVLSQIENPGTYSWFLLLFLGYIAKFKKIKNILALNIPLLCVLVCIASPVNGLIRYSLPLLGTFPLYFCWVFKKDEDDLSTV